VSEELIGQTMKVKLLEVDEETERLVFSNRRASSETQMAGHKVVTPTFALALLRQTLGLHTS
jgi:ribosomal protein S1